MKYDKEYLYLLSCEGGALEVIEYLMSFENNNCHVLEIHNAMMIGIMSFFNNNDEFSHDKYVKIKKCYH